MWLELLEKGDAVIFARPLSLFRMHGGQEGRQADSVVRGILEWWRLVDDYWHRRIFLTQEEDYRFVLNDMRLSAKKTVDPLLPQISPELRRAYEMEEISRI